MNAGYSAIPSVAFLHQLEDDERRNGFVADHVRTRLALLIRNLREQNGWSQAELGRRLGKPQSVISRLEDPDYGRLSLQTLFEVAAVFGLPLYIDMPDWDEWFRLMEDMSSQNLLRRRFDMERLVTTKIEPPAADGFIAGPLIMRGALPLQEETFFLEPSFGVAAVTTNGEGTAQKPFGVTTYLAPPIEWYAGADRRMSNVG
jgi:transcriptional regulator with XRE-family HTH domain